MVVIIDILRRRSLTHTGTHIGRSAVKTGNRKHTPPRGPVTDTNRRYSGTPVQPWCNHTRAHDRKNTFSPPTQQRHTCLAYTIYVGTTRVSCNVSTSRPIFIARPYTIAHCVAIGSSCGFVERWWGKRYIELQQTSSLGTELVPLGFRLSINGTGFIDV